MRNDAAVVVLYTDAELSVELLPKAVSFIVKFVGNSNVFACF